MFVVPGPFVPHNDTITLLTYKRLRNLDLDMDVFAFRGKEDQGLLKELEKDELDPLFPIIKYSSSPSFYLLDKHIVRLSTCIGNESPNLKTLCQRTSNTSNTAKYTPLSSLLPL